MPIRLVSTVSCTLCSSLYNELKSLGYKNIDVIDNNDLTDTDSIENWGFVHIVPFNNESWTDYEDYLNRILRKVSHQPVLGVFSTASRQWNCDAAASCNEFLYWPCDIRELELRLKRLAKMLQIQQREESARSICDEFLRLNMIGSSPVFIHVLHQIKKIARCDAPVLIQGESGTGKELTARSVHYFGGRRDSPFIPVNCGAIPDSLLENELFGHRQGAFTDAKTNQDGLVCQAEGGTLFLDEVETFSPKGQVVLLRFLQDLQYKSLGSSRNKRADVRIIAASNAMLQELVDRGEFRKDLYYRLAIMQITMPPLAQRGNDVLELADYFLGKFSVQYNQPVKTLDRDSVQWLLQYVWPGNVRELENLLHRQFLLTDTACIRLGEHPARQQDRRMNSIDRRQKSIFNSKMQDAKTEIMRNFEVEYLSRLLNRTNGNITQAARISGKERRSLGKLIKKHGIDKTVLRNQ
jgi:DNA-binding NtrC family response regulator